MTNGSRPNLFIKAGISILLLVAGLYVLVTSEWNTQPALVAAATGWVGVVIGYWLK